MSRSFALIAPVWRILQQVSCSSGTVPNAPKWKVSHQNMSLGSNGVDQERSLRKFLIRHRGMNFCINCTSLECFASSLCSSIMVPNAPKQKETHENMSLESNCVDREHPFREILMRLCGTNSCINCTKLAHFAPSFVQLRNGSKCTQTERNAPKNEFRVQWCGSGAFVAKNSNKTTLHELLH